MSKEILKQTIKAVKPWLPWAIRIASAAALGSTLNVSLVETPLADIPITRVAVLAREERLIFYEEEDKRHTKHR